MEDSTNLSISNNNETNNNSFMANSSSVEFEPIHEQPAKIKVIGVGGGGGNAVNHMFREGIHGVEFIVCNTDAKALESSPVPNKIALGKLGAGNIPEHARKMALEHKEEILSAISDDTQMLFITAGMGGGTGTGAAPVVAELAKGIDLDDELVPKILVVAIVTEPFEFEGPVRMQQAKAGIEELKKHVDAILVINNDNLRRLGDMDLDEAFSKADDVLLTAAKGIAEIITMGGKVNIDFRDVNTVMNNSGTALMGTGSGRGENRALEAIENAATSVLLNDNDIRGAKNVLLYFSYAPNHKIKMDELYNITNYVKERTGHTANVIWGNGTDENLDDELRITLIATGFEPLPGRTVINLDTVEQPSPKDETPQTDPKKDIPTQDIHENPIDESGIHLIHRITTENSDQVENNVEKTEEQPQNNISNEAPKRYFTLESITEEVSKPIAKVKETIAEPAKEIETNSHLDDIRVISREMIHSTSSTPNPNMVSAQPDVETSLLDKPVTEPVNNATPAPTAAALNSQLQKAFSPDESVDDIKARQRAERIRRMNDLLRNDPDGPRIIEEIPIEELANGPIYEAPHSSESDAARTRVNAGGFFSTSMDFLNGLPD